jgi:hypothetical protein
MKKKKKQLTFEQELELCIKNELNYLVAEGFVEVLPPDSEHKEYRYRLAEYEDKSIKIPDLPDYFE